MSATFFIVRATVTNAGKRVAFDRWYEKEHLLDAVGSFGTNGSIVCGSSRLGVLSGLAGA
ncbi:hypothetical protein AYJ54_42230 [Bradyrhizobium centrolobii]|uniref:Uncharacterized protein n=1 Tax=Bradyrhizobium centrolobii TaxID=1505087 RepID=A0A176Z196_9BRAD|nr:hypothetical protein [Bradyrhizobium centrolobii]OAF14191.1 hypothetical protein AYJ54_42230 [Bradyrhizobium centrolobii]